MKIAYIGYGKMGKTIEAIALQKGHETVLKIDEQNPNDLTVENLKKADVAIEFSTPATAFDNIQKCFDAGTPVVCGTTAWLVPGEEKQDFIDNKPSIKYIRELCEKKGGTLLYSSNFSIGVNIFMEINRKLAGIMNKQKQYDISMLEIHHTQKKDAPSGTAITLANDILKNIDRKEKWISITDKPSEAPDPAAIPIISKREDEVPGLHTITYKSSVDTIVMTHEAFSRQGFAEGALFAAEWLHGKKGFYEMSHALNIFEPVSAH